MASDKPPEVKAGGWPFSVRKGLEWCIKQLSRKFVVRYENVQSPKVLESSEDITIVLPSGGGLIGVQVTGPVNGQAAYFVAAAKTTPVLIVEE